jgi:transposase
VSSYIPEVDRYQTVLLPDALEDFIVADSPIRVIAAFVDGLPMETLGFTRATPAVTGRPGYDPRALVKLYLYGYLNRVRSSRRLERETHRNVEVMWLLGRLRPDHKTISDFRGTQPDALRQVFRQFTLVCQRLELFGAELVAIDGTKLRAVNAKGRSFTPAELQRLLARIDAKIASYVHALEAADAQDATAATPETTAVAGLPEKLAQVRARQAEYQTLLTQLETSGATQVTLTDPESRRMKDRHGVQVGYNAQIAVDAKHHLLVTTAVTNEGNDEHQLGPMARAAQAELGVTTLSVVADAGYCNGPEVAHCLELGITPTVPPVRTNKQARAGRFPKSAFVYDPQTDRYHCPGAATLPFRFETTEDGQRQRYYYHFAACAACPLRARCTSARDPANGRRIMRWAKEHLLEAMEARRLANPQLMVQRRCLVEHPFGTMKRWDDASYFLLKGLAKVAGEFSLMGLAYNVRRAIAVVGVPRLLASLRAGHALASA